MKKYLYSAIPLAAVLLCSLFLCTSLDDKVFDLFLRTTPPLPADKSVLLVNIDDVSIEKVGIYPWTRDVMADAIVFLREMGAESVVFDLSFLNKSPVKVDPDYVQNELPGYLDSEFGRIDETVSQVMDAFASGQLGSRDAEEYKRQLLDFNREVHDSVSVSVSYVARDVDAYFARTLRYFGNSYLTLTMVTPKSLGGDAAEFRTNYDIPWLEQHIALSNVTADHDTLTQNQPGIIPAIPELLTNSHGAGFVNAEPDADGYRRRVNLLFKFHDRYYAQLAFRPLLERFGNPEIRVTNSKIVLKDARTARGTRDITIPRARDGSILVKWPPIHYMNYNAISAWDLIGNDEQEAILTKNIKAMEDAGFFSFWTGNTTPLEQYNNAKYVKDAILNGEKPEDGITFDAYLEYRRSFLELTDAFLNGPSETHILASIPESDAKLRFYVSSFFASARIQYADLLAIRAKARDKANGAMCVIGVCATSMTDEGLTTYQENFPNVGLHATVANMILAEDFLDDSPRLVSVLIAVILSLSLAHGVKRLDSKKSLLAGILTLAFCVLALLAFFMITHRYIGVVVPFASAAITFITLTAINFLTTIREKSFLRSAFSRYLSPAVINEIIADPSKLNLGGEKREMTAIFTDIRGFSGISEKLDPADLVQLLNLYLTEMSNIVLDNRGTIDKYEGDAIIAFFGAPVHMNEHAILACRTAVLMKKAEVALNRKIMEEKLSPVPLFTRIGINTGDMIVGNMGTPNKMDYTVMGNAVNLAARLEGVNKHYHTRGILISEHTRNNIGDEFLIRRLDRVRVVGVNTPLRLFELVGIVSESNPHDISLTASWESAMDAYEQKDFAEAAAAFADILARDPDDGVARLYAANCADYIANPPPADWDGVVNLTQK